MLHIFSRMSRTVAGLKVGRERLLIGKLIWSKDIGLTRTIAGSGISSVNENELDEVRTIEEGFKKAYEWGSKRDSRGC